MLDIRENTIILVESNERNKLLKYLENQGLCPVKLMSKIEFRKKFYFDYDDRALACLMSKHHYQYEVAKMYLSHLYEVEDEDFGSDKILKIIELRRELDREGLLIYSNFFKDYLKNKKVILYNQRDISKLDLKMIDEVKKISQVEKFNKEENQYHHECIWSFDTIHDEVSFVASKIVTLVHEGIDITRFKLCVVNSEYYPIIKRIFEWYNLSIVLDDNYLYSTKIAQDFLESIDEGIDKSLEILKNNYSFIDSNISMIYNQIIEIVNRYVWCTDIELLKTFIIEDFKMTSLKVTHYEEEIAIIHDLSEVDNNDYVFLLGFNQGDIPKIFKDEDYFNDSLKNLLGLDITSELNSKSYSKWIRDILTTKNLIITTKSNSDLGVCYLSAINDELGLEVRKGEVPITNSNLYNKIQLVEKLDTFIKYNEKQEGLEKLFSHYPDIEYRTYNANFSSISPDKIKEYIHHKFNLSYSTMNTYYQCGFRYYLDNILRLNMYEESFYTVIGNLFHYILSIYWTRDIDVKEEYQKYIDNCTYPFNERELFFLDMLESELEFVINTINKQNEYSELTNIHTEEKIEIDKSRKDLTILFKGFVDKMLFNDNEDIVSIIDYKTGNPSINLNHIIYGLDMQLSVYIYLVKHKYEDADIAGFYLQKILNTEITRDNKHTYLSLKEDKLKLQGYSNKDTSILEKFDSGYCESKVIKGMRTTSKGLASKKVMDSIDIEAIRKLTDDKIEEAITGIENGNFAINPKRIGMENVGCKYCNYRDICFMNETNIINLKEYKNMEFLGGEEDDTSKTN